MCPMNEKMVSFKINVDFALNLMFREFYLDALYSFYKMKMKTNVKNHKYGISFFTFIIFNSLERKEFHIMLGRVITN